MKALEILKNCRARGQKRAGGLDLDEAIIELEEAMKPIIKREWYQKGYKAAMSNRCGECRYSEPFTNVCCNGDSPLCADVVPSDFGCIYFEPKDNL